MRMIHAFLVAIVGSLFLLETGLTQWSTDPVQNLKVAGGGINPEICIDGNGGCFIVWETGAAGNRRLLRLQHLNRYGYKSLPEQGISLAGEEFDQSTPFYLAYGGNGSAIVLFYDTRVIDGNFVAKTLAQRVDSTGRLLWGDRGISLSSTPVTQRSVALLADQSGGAVVFWAEDRDLDGVQEMFGNRITANGQSQWGKDGRRIAVYENNEIRTQAVSDLNGGFFVAYEKKIDLYVHHLKGNGELLWPDAIKMPIGIWGVLTSDNAGGFFWTAHEQVGYQPPWGAIYRTRVFRYNFAAQSMWPEAGVAITDSAFGSQAPEVIVNSQDDIIIIYQSLYESSSNIFAQRLNFNAELTLEYGGQPVVSDYRDYPARRTLHQTCSGANGNILVIWQDWRMQTRNLYAQLFYEKSILNLDLPVSSRPEVQQSHRVASDGYGGGIVVWYEIGTGSGWGIFAQQISRNGGLGEVVTTSVDSPPSGQQSSSIPLSFSAFPNPFLDTVQFRLRVSENLRIVVQVFDLAGRVVREFHSSSAQDGNLSLRWDGKDQYGRTLPSGIYVVKATAGKHVAGQKVILIR